MAKGPTAPAPQEQPAPPRVVPKRDPRADVGLMVAEIVGFTDQLKKAHVGFHTLNLAYLTVSGQLPAGERKKGLPLFEFTGVLEGAETREPVKCVADLKKLPKNYVPHVLVPLISIHASDLLEAVTEMRARLDHLQPALEAIVAQVQPAEAEPDAEDEDEEDDEE